MKQNVHRLLCVLALALLIPIAALAQIDTADLTAGIWMDHNSSIEFKEDGSGVFVNDSGKSFEMTWTQAGDQIRVEYQFYGSRSLSLTSAETNGVWTLTDEDGNAYVVSSAEAAEDRAYTAALGEEIDLGFAKMTFTRLQMMSAMRASSSSSIAAPDDSHYFVLVGTITNNGNSDLEVGNVWSEITLNQNAYAASAMADQEKKLTTTVAPKATGDYYIFGAIPDTATKAGGSGEIRLAFNDGFKGTPSNQGRADFVFRLTFDDNDLAQAWQAPEREMVYFADCPALPRPASYADVSTYGDETGKDEYSYKMATDDDAESLLDIYRNGLIQSGYGVRDFGGPFRVFSGTTRIADVSVDRSGRVTVKIPKGLSDFSERPEPGTVGTAPGPIEVHIGDTITPNRAEMTIDDYGATDKIYSSIKAINGTYDFKAPANKGDRLFYLHGKFKNVSNSQMDIRYIYIEFIFDDQYHYMGLMAGAESGARSFIKTAVSQYSCDYYMYTPVPNDVLKNYKTCKVRIGFTDNFDTTIYVANNLPIFAHCDTEYELIIK